MFAEGEIFDPAYNHVVGLHRPVPLATQLSK